MKHRPAGKRTAVRPLKRFLDCCIEIGMGHKAKVPENMMMAMMTICRKISGGMLPSARPHTNIDTLTLS
jgi:hypothetical protein